MTGDRFAGAWRVRETVFDLDARPVGVIAQSRQLATISEDELSVVQDCAPSPSLRERPIAAFDGHHEFRVRRDGRHRRWLGPAVIGDGLELDAGVMIGRGLWPALGWSFTSWSIRVADDRQLTGGVFERGGTTVAALVGVAAPIDDAPPVAFEAATAAGEVAPVWRGVCRRLDPGGNLQQERPIVRRCVGGGWRDGDGLGEDLAIDGTAGALSARGSVAGVPVVGAGQRRGPTLSLELWSDAGLAIEVLDVVDPLTRTFTAIRRHHWRDRLVALEVARLHPAGAPS